MKKSKNIITVLLICFCASFTKAHADSFFQLPIVPDTMAFNNRIDYLVQHYWDFCDLKKAFSAKQKMVGAFREYMDLMPLASQAVAIPSINKFIRSIESKPENLLTIASAAEDYIHSDTSQIYSDELYLPFIEAVAKNKKISSAQKARYEHQYRLISNSLVGNPIPNIEFIDRDNNQKSLYGDSAKVVLLYIFDTDCPDCALTKIRLDADIPTTKLIDAGNLRIVALTTASPDAEFLNRTKNYPSAWTVGASPDLDEQIEIRSVPSFYILDGDHRIHGKNLSIDQVLAVTHQLAENVRDPYVKKHWDELRNKSENN